MRLVKDQNGIKYYKYDDVKYPFVKIVTDFFNIENLEDLHNIIPKDSINQIKNELFTNENDAHTLLHSLFYKKLNEGWPELVDAYHRFIKDVMTDIMGTNDLIYQSFPSFRIQFPDNIAVGGNPGDTTEEYGWHKDSDPGYNHPIVEKNFIIPLTRSRDTASVYIETDPGTREYYPAIMNPGEIFNFRGSTCRHGNKKNESGKCRVSFDFRVILPDDYDENYVKNSKLSTKKFTVGEYYERTI